MNNPVKEGLPLCLECNRLKEDEEEAREEIDDLERQISEAEDHWGGISEELKAHQEIEHGEDDPWLLHLLAESLGQLNFLEAK